MKQLFLLILVISLASLLYLFKDKLLNTSQIFNFKNGWKIYKTQDVESGVSISYPDDWIIKFKKTEASSTDFPAKFILKFDIAPASWPSQENIKDQMGWGGLIFKAFNLHSNINEFISSEYPIYKDYLVYSTEKSIGSKPTYYLKAKPNAPFYDSWKPTYVVLGTLYSYEVSFFDTGEYGFTDKLQQKILPVTFIY